MVFFRFAPKGKVEKTRFKRNWTTFVNPAFCPAWKSPLKMVVWNRPRGIRSQGCFFVSPRWGKSKKLRFERNWMTFLNPAFWMQLDDVRQPGFLHCLEKPTQNGGMKPTSWNSIPRVFFRFAPMGKVEKTRLERNWTTFVNPAFCPAWKSPVKMVVWNRPSGIRSQWCFSVSPRWGKSKKRVLNAIGRRSSTRLFALLGKAHSKWWYETDLVEFDPKGVFSFRPDGEGRKKRVFNAIGRRSSTRLFALLGKAHSKWWYETDLVEFHSKGVFSFRPDGESRKNAFWTQLDDVREPGFLPCLEKPTQNGGMKPTSWNSIPRVFYRFAPMGKVEKTRLERNWTTFVNPAFCLAWKSPLKMVVWNRPRGIRSQGCFCVSPRWGKSKKRVLNLLGKRAWKSPLKMVVWNQPRGIRSQGCFCVSPRWGKSKKRVLNAIGRRSSTRLFAVLGKAHSKWWYETDLVEFDPKGVFSFRPDGESRKKRVLNAIGRRSSTRLFALLGKAHSKWWYETDLVEFDPNGVFSFPPYGECRKNAFWTELDDVRQPGFLPCLEKPTQTGGMKPSSWYSIPRVFLRFAPIGKVEKTRLERNWTKFVNPAFCPAWKSPLKMVVWNRPRGILSQGCCFVSPRWGKSKKGVLNAIGRRSSTRLFALLGKAHSKWWYETDLVEFDPKGVFSFRPDGESRKNAFWTQLDDVRQPGVLPCLEKPTQNGGMKPTSWNSIPRVLFRFAPMGKVEKTRFERNWTTFVNPAFCPAWKSPLKLVVWNRARGIRSQGCFCVSPRLGKSKKRVLNAIGQSSSTWLFALLGKAHSKWWYETDHVEFFRRGVVSFRPDGESRKKAFWTQLDDVRQPGFLPCLEKPTQNGGMKPTSLNSIPRVFFRFAPMGKSRKNAFWKQLDDVRQPGFLHCLEKPTQNGGMKPTSWNSIPRVFFGFAPMGKVEKTRFERNWTTFVNPAFCPAWKSPLKMVVWNRPRGIRP